MTNYSQGSSSFASRVKFAVISCGSTQWLRQLAAIREIRRTDVNLSTTESETQVELSFAVVEIKHTIKRSK